MTENETINHINLMCHRCVGWHGGKCHEYGYCFEARQIAIQALKEIQQYRAMGTVEEFKAIKSDGFTDHLLNMGYTKGYLEAIDKFEEKMKELVYKWIDKGVIAIGGINEIAEQMKKGE